MPKKKQHNQTKTATDREEDDQASMDHALVDDEMDPEDANAVDEVHGANILAIQLLRADFTIVSSSRLTKRQRKQLVLLLRG